MDKYIIGLLLTASSIAVIAGYNINIVTGVASAVLVLGVAYMIIGLVEGIIRSL